MYFLPPQILIFLSIQPNAGQFPIIQDKELGISENKEREEARNNDERQIKKKEGKQKMTRKKVKECNLFCYLVPKCKNRLVSYLMTPHQPQRLFRVESTIMNAFVRVMIQLMTIIIIIYTKELQVCYGHCQRPTSVNNQIISIGIHS